MCNTYLHMYLDYTYIQKYIKYTWCVISTYITSYMALVIIPLCMKLDGQHCRITYLCTYYFFMFKIRECMGRWHESKMYVYRAHEMSVKAKLFIHSVTFTSFQEQTFHVQIVRHLKLSLPFETNYREFSPNANFITANFITAVFQNFPKKNCLMRF